MAPRERGYEERDYEVMLIVQPNASEEALEAVKAKVCAVVNKFGGVVHDYSAVGKRRLAYIMQKSREGVYHICRFRGNGQVVRELNRILSIDESVLRNMTTRLPDLGPVTGNSAASST